MSKIAWFKVAKRVIGPGYQTRVRTFDGQEDTVNILDTLPEAQREWDKLSKEMIPLEERP